MNKEVSELIRRLRKQKWDVVQRNHLKAYPPDSAGPKDYVLVPISPSDYRSLKETVNKLEYRGYIQKGKKKKKMASK